MGVEANIRELSKDALEGYWHLCPNFVIELKSASDRSRPLREKLREYMVHGAELGWLIDAKIRTVEIYRPKQEPEPITGAETVLGEGPVEGFVLNLIPVWDPLAD